MALLSDGVKKWSVLIPTEILPTKMRVSMRRSLLAKLELEKARITDLLIIGHPKSGNTWLRTQLSRMYQIRYGLPSGVVVTSDELKRQHPEMPRISATNAAYSYEGAVGEALDGTPGDSVIRNKPIIFLARDPRDIAVSWFHQFTKRQSRQKQELINHFIEHPIDKNSVQMWEFVRHSDIGLPFLIEFLNRWERLVPSLPNAIRIRYEDLRSDPVTQIMRIGELIGDPYNEDQVREAVAFGSFDNLRKLESEGHFKQGGLALRNPNDPNSFKVRRAKVGGYRDDFSAEQVAELDELVARNLAPSLGYTSTLQMEPIAANG